MQNDLGAKGKVFVGLHFCPGVAQYAEPNKDPFTIFLNEDTLRKMNKSFAGRPVFVRHVDGVPDSLEKTKEEADGWVVKSFYNEIDGKTWVEFVAVTEKAIEAVQKGWKLSNAYVPTSFGQGGVWNGVPYSQEVVDGEFEHLAIVPDPRYAESIILTPEEFKAYNEKKVIELKKLSNSKGEESITMGLNFFKRAKVENAVDLESTLVTLPKSKIDKSIAQLVNEMDDVEMKKSEPHQMANAEHMVECNGDKMSVGDLVKKHMDCMNDLEEMKKKHVDGLDPSEDKSEEASDIGEKADKAAKNESKPEMDKMEGKDIKDPVKKNAFFDMVMNAETRAPQHTEIETSMDRLARGQARYGSSK